MIILTIRTDREEAELSLFDGHKKMAEEKWHAHRTLAATIHKKLLGMLDLLSISLEEVQGIVCFQGPGSFTGLRIGLSVANALAYSQNIPIVARRGNNWSEAGIKDLMAGKNEKIVTPFYGRPANTTAPKK